MANDGTARPMLTIGDGEHAAAPDVAEHSAGGMAITAATTHGERREPDVVDDAVR